MACADIRKLLGGDMNTNGDKYKELAKWIKDGWRLPEADKFRHRYLPVENGKYTISLYTLGFALLGKVGDLKKGITALEKKVDGVPDPFDATAEFFGVPKSVLKRIGDLEGPVIRKQPTEIAEMLENGRLYGDARLASRATRPSRATARKR
jgi:hypothetical protein